MANKAAARYLESPTVQRKTSRGHFSLFIATATALLAILGTLLIGVLVAYSSQESNRPVVTNAAAQMNLCGVIGLQMDGRASWRASWDVALPDLDNRRFMLSEVVPNSTWWSHFSGTGSESDVLAGAWDDEIEGPNSTRSGAALLPKASELPDALQPFRNTINCTLGTIPSTVGGWGINFANFVTKISGFVATLAFNSSFICDINPSPGQVCIDMLGLLGGRGQDVNEGGDGNGGIIGNLTTGLYQPLILIVMLITAGTVFYTGIIKRKYREAFVQFLWFFGSAIIGFALLLNPGMLVKAPMVVGNTVVGCVVGAFNGNGCTGGSSSAAPGAVSSTSAKDNICRSTATGGNAEDNATLFVNSMSCSIWSAFVLEPYAVGAFGLSLNQLDLDSVIDPSASPPQTVRSLLEGPGWNVGGTSATEPGNANVICVNLATNESYNSMGSTFQGRGNVTSGSAGAVCNLAVWDLFMKTSAVGGSITSANNNPDNQWFPVLSRLPANTEMFGAYTDSTGAGGLKIQMGVLATFSGILGSFLIVAVSVMALVYYVIAMIMMAFAPVFFLLGMHPGRGKKMMLGWLEQVVGNLMKYMVSAVFLLIAIAFYGAILGASTGLWTSVLFVVLITMALWMYRKELINLLSRVDMGGEKVVDMAQGMMDGTSRFGKKIGGPTRAVAAGAVAGLTTGAGIGVGVKAAANRELRQGNSFRARAFQAADAIGTDNKNDLYKIEKAKMDEARDAEKAATDAENVAIQNIEQLEPLEEEAKKAEEETIVANAEAVDASNLAAIKTKLDNAIQVEFVDSSDYGNAKKDFEVKGITGAEAFDSIAKKRDRHAELIAETGDAYGRGDTERQRELEAETRALESELKRDITEFQRDYKGAGAATAYAAIEDKKTQIIQIGRDRDIAEATGDKEEAAKLSEIHDSMEISLKHDVKEFQDIYSSVEYRRAENQYGQVAKGFVDHYEDPEGTPENKLMRENFLKVSLLGDEKISQAVVETTAAQAAAEGKQLIVDTKLSDASDALKPLLENASRARSDAAFATAEADYLTQVRTDFTPGEIVSRGKIDKILKDAEIKAGAEAARHAEYGDALTKAITEYDKVPDYTKAKGERLIEAEAKMKEKERAKAEETIAERNINLGEQARLRATRELMEAQALAKKVKNEEEASLPAIPGLGLIPNKNIQAKVLATEKNAAEKIYEEASAEKLEKLAIFTAAEASARDQAVRSPETATAEAKENSAQAEIKLAEARAELSEASRREAQLEARMKEAQGRFQEARMTPESDVAAKRIAEAEANLSKLNQFETAVPKDVLESLALNPDLQRRLVAIEKTMGAMGANATEGKLSHHEAAQAAEAERQISKLGLNPSEAEIKRIESLIPKASKPQRRLPTAPAAADRPTAPPAETPRPTAQPKAFEAPAAESQPWSVPAPASTKEMKKVYEDLERGQSNLKAAMEVFAGGGGSNSPTEMRYSQLNSELENLVNKVKDTKISETEMKDLVNKVAQMNTGVADEGLATFPNSMKSETIRIRESVDRQLEEIREIISATTRESLPTSEPQLPPVDQDQESPKPRRSSGIPRRPNRRPDSNPRADIVPPVNPGR